MIDSTALLATLQDVGLSENQARVYLALLSLGSEKPTRIAQVAGIKRSTVYPVLESLQKLGVVSEDLTGFKKRFVAENPERLEAIVEMRHRQLRRSLGDLAALYSLQRGESALKYYEGVESTRTVYNGMLDVVEPGDDYLIMSSPAEWLKLDEEFLRDFTARRAKLDLNIKGLFIDSPTTQEWRQREKEFNLEAKIFPKDISFTVNIVIVPRCVLIHQLVPPVWAIIIENRDIVRTHSEFFWMFWKLIP